MKWIKNLLPSKKKGIDMNHLVSLIGNAFGIKDSYNFDRAKNIYTKSLYVYACVSQIAQNVASLDWNLFKIVNKEGERKELYIHPLIDLIYRPNPYDTKISFFEKAIILKKLCGNVFIWKERNERGKIVNLWILDQSKIKFVEDENENLIGYNYELKKGGEVYYPREDIIHDKYPTPLETYFGLSPLEPSITRVSIEQLSNQYQKDFFYNNAKPDGILSTTQRLTREQVEEIKREWSKNYQGLGKNNKTAVLQGEMDYKTISISQREMDLIESMKFTRDDILVAFHVPKPIIAITDDVNRANAESALVIFMAETVKPEMERLVEKINEEMVIPDFGEDLHFDFIDPTPEHRDLIIKEYASSIRNGWRTINEVRALEGLEPLPGGDDAIRPDRSQISETEQGRGEQSGTKKKWVIHKNNKLDRLSTALYNKITKKEEVVEKIVNTIKLKKKEIEKKKIDSFIKQKSLNMDRDINKFKGVMKTFFAEQYKRFIKALQITERKGKKKSLDIYWDMDWEKEAKYLIEVSEPLLKEAFEKRGIEAGKLVGHKFNAQEFFHTFIQSRAIKFAHYVNVTTEKNIRKAIDKGLQEGLGIRDIAQNISKVYENRIKNDAVTIARTEVAIATGEADAKAYEQSGVVEQLQWKTAEDELVRESHMWVNLQIVNRGDTFSNGLEYPGQDGAPIEEVVNCRCVALPIVEGSRGYTF